jgi:hypothetical protein
MDVATGAERWNVTYSKLEMLHGGAAGPAGGGEGTGAPQLPGQVGAPLSTRVRSVLGLLLRLLGAARAATWVFV